MAALMTIMLRMTPVGTLMRIVAATVVTVIAMVVVTVVVITVLMLGHSASCKNTKGECC
jgi:hypothetical protein